TPELAAVLGGERFLREIEIAARLTHPHVLPLYDSGEADGVLFYVMPFVEGESLRDRLAREKQLPLDDALQIAREVADALSYAHSHDVVHRDIKPENILLESGHAVVADFGIARAITAAGGTKLTETGMAIGTPAYMSPEQAAGSQDLDGRSDLYSLGCVLYEMLAGQPPFTGPTVESVVHQHLAMEPHPITSLRPAVPAEVAAALQRALAKTPADRFNPVAQFGEALRPAVARTGPPAAGTAAAAGAERPSRWVRIAALGVGAAVVVAGLWFGIERLKDRALPPGQRPYTIVAEVEGSADLETRRAVRGLVASALDASGIIAALPDDQIRLGLSQAGKPETTTLDIATARELAVRGSMRAIVAATADRIGGAYTVNVRVLDADSGTMLTAARGVANGDDALITTVDGVVGDVRRWLGERREAINPTRASVPVMTPSFEAYQKYRRGGPLVGNDNERAISLLREAVTLDTGFALAYRGLAAAYLNTGKSDSARWALSAALRHRDRLLEGQLHAVQGLQAWERGDIAGAAALLERARDEPGGNCLGPNLAVALDVLGRTEEAVRVVEECERRSPFGVSQTAIGNQIEYLASLGRFDEARRRVDQLTSPANRDRYGGLLEAMAGNWTVAESLITSENAPDLHAAVLAARGRVSEAASILTARNWLRRPLLVLSVASHRPVDLTTPAELRRDTTLNGRSLAALWATAAGDTSTGRTLLGALVALPEEERRGFDAEIQLVQGWLAMSGGDWQSAIRLLTPGAVRRDHIGPRIKTLARWLLADAHERLGQLDSAAAYLGMVAEGKGLISDELGRRGLTHSFAHQRLVVLYSRMGRLSDARRHWRIFSEAFTHPDPELVPLVEQARAALEEAERRR
ncbi:MAG: protein kinase, partial [Gemmatimonadetes bacterium]|nr:protein kinase [Gemmatimonadota bacterium]